MRGSGTAGEDKQWNRKSVTNTKKAEARNVLQAGYKELLKQFADVKESFEQKFSALIKSLKCQEEDFEDTKMALELSKEVHQLKRWVSPRPWCHQQSRWIKLAKVYFYISSVFWISCTLLLCLLWKILEYTERFPMPFQSCFGPCCFEDTSSVTSAYRQCSASVVLLVLAADVGLWSVSPPVPIHLDHPRKSIRAGRWWILRQTRQCICIAIGLYSHRGRCQHLDWIKASRWHLPQVRS